MTAIGCTRPQTPRAAVRELKRRGRGRLSACIARLPPGLALRRALLCIALLCLLSGERTAAAPVDLHLEIRRDGDAVLVDAYANLHARPALAWAVLTDYDHYAAFVPDLTASFVLERSGDTATVEQRGVARFLFYRVPLDVRLAVTEDPPRSVHCESIGGSFKQLDGVYRLLPTNEGVRFAYRGRLVPGFDLPPLIGMAMLRAAITRQLEGLVHEIVRRSARTLEARP